MMNENYRKKAVNVKLIFAATAMATLALSAHSLKASAVPVDNFITPTAVQQQKTTVAGTVTEYICSLGQEICFGTVSSQ